MKLLNGDQAIIDPRKVTDYCLSLDHDDGSHKARLFQALIGLNQDNSTLLLKALRTAAATPTSPTQREFCRFSLFSATQVIELLNPCTPNSPQYRL